MKYYAHIFMAGASAMLVTACSGNATAPEGLYTCVNGDSLLFRPDGTVDEMRNHRERAYVIEGDTLKILRDRDREADEANVRMAYRIDDDRLISARNPQFFCIKGNRQEMEEVKAEQPKAPEPEKFVGKERPGTQVAEVLTLRLGDSLSDVRRKMTALDPPMVEMQQTLVTETPTNIYESLMFNRPGKSEMATVYFSPPPQRVIGVVRDWMDSSKPVSWKALMERESAKYGPTTEFAMSSYWFLNEAGKPTDAPPYINECGGMLVAKTKEPRCGRTLEYWATGNKNEPITSYKASLYDPDAIFRTQQAWAEIARNAKRAEQVQAEEKARANGLPD